MNRPSGRSHDTFALAAWLACCFTAASGAAFVSTGDWYAALRKPAWSPPAWLFGPAWTLLYIALTVVEFWRVKRVAGALLMPYLAWVTFAAALNFSIWRLNG